MSAQTVPGGGGSISRASALTAFPYTMAIWCRFDNLPGATNTSGIIYNMAANVSFYVGAAFQDDGTILLDATAGGTATTGTLVLGTWNYIVLRGISATNRRLDVLYADGTSEHIQGTSSSTGTMGSLIVGPSANNEAPEVESARYAEFWYTNTDIQSGGAALNASTLHQLAFQGPFSVPHIGASVQEYFSLQSDFHGSNTNTEYYSSVGPKVWTVSVLSPAEHPPLPYNYVKPGQRKTTLMV